MKKAISLLLVFVLCIFVFAACNGGKSSGGDKKVLTVAMNAQFKPFEYLEGKKIVGSDVDMIYAIGDVLGYEVEITNIDFDSALTGAATGKYDVAVSGITATEERKKSMGFSDDYYKASQAIIVLDGSNIKGINDLKGKTISCQEGTTGEQYLLDNKYSIASFKTASEAISALVKGKVDATVIDNAVAIALSKEQGGKTVVLDEPLTEEAYAILTKLGNDELISELNRAIKELKSNGKLAEIYEKYDLPYDE